MVTNTENVEPSCSFCGQRQSAVKLIAGPAIMICAECVARSGEIARDGDGGVPSNACLVQEPNRPGGLTLLFFPKRAAKRREQPMCSFCGMSRPGLVQPPSTLGLHALICDQCLKLCQDIIECRLGSA